MTYCIVYGNIFKNKHTKKKKERERESLSAILGITAKGALHGDCFVSMRVHMRERVF